EIGSVLLEQLALGRIVLQDDAVLLIQASHHHIMQRRAPLRLKRDDQRPPLLQVLLQVVPFTAKGKRAETVPLEIMLQVGSIDSARFRSVEGALDLLCIGKRLQRLPLALPVLHHHRDTGGATTIFLLRDEGDVQPYPATVGSQQRAPEK